MFLEKAVLYNQGPALKGLLRSENLLKTNILFKVKHQVTYILLNI